MQRDHHVGRLQIAVDDAFLMCMLDGIADADEEIETVARAESLRVAVLSDGDAFDEFHHEVGASAVGRAGVQHAGDIGVVHQGQGLPLGVEAGQRLLGVHAQFDDLQGDLANHRLGLLGHVDGAEAAFADLLQQLVRTDLGAQGFGGGRGVGGS